ISPTAERYSLLGSTHKRRAFVTMAYSNKKKALAEAAFNYQHAYKIAGEDAQLYPMINWYMVETILVLLGERKWEQKTGTGALQYELPSLNKSLVLLAQKKKELANANKSGYSYNDQIAVVNIMLCECLMAPQKTTQKDFDELLMAYRKTWAKVGSRAKKMSEIEQLEIIIDALSSSENRQVIKLNKMITGVKDSLQKMLER
ncbi:MAG TPA: tetratricopeptide repeat-containing protein, partial [Ferruginibacter sp.]|nr:tetratricopeptide repeat-containing protein [Ferruginibacter sp.]